MMQRSRSVTVIGALVAALALAVGAPAQAGFFTPPVHADRFGAHALVDEAALPGATCLRGGDATLDGIRVRWPVVYARSGRTSQVVGWRFRVISADGPYDTLFQNGFVKKTATPTRNARFSDRSASVTSFITLGLVKNPRYAIAVDLRWYAADGVTVTGRSSHFVRTYRSAGLVQPTCAYLDSPAGSDLTSHSDAFGVHTLYDETSRPGAVCTHGLPPDDDLVSIRVHWPVVFARAGRTSQVVGWRFRVMTFDGDWHEVDRVGFTKATATPRRSAPFSGRTIPSADFPGSGPYSVWVDLRWYASDGATVTGSSTHPVANYLIREGTTPIGVSEGCGGTTG